MSTNYSLTGNARIKKNNLSQRDVKKPFSIEQSKYLNFEKIKNNVCSSVDLVNNRKPKENIKVKNVKEIIKKFSTYINTGK